MGKEERNWKCVSLVSVTIASAIVGQGSGEARAESYESKRLTVVIGYKPGGSADADGRLVAKHLRAQIPGNPNIIVRNMPGAGGITAVNYAYNVAPPDGLSIYQLGSGHYLQQLAGSKVVKFDVTKMPILGAWTRSHYALVVRTDKFKTIEELRKSKEPVRVATSGIGTGTYLYTVAWQKALGYKHQLISGYGSGEQDLALERGEVDARTNAVSSTVSKHPEWFAKDLARVLVVGGPDRDPLLPNVPTVREVNPNPGAFFDVVSEGLAVARPYAMPPKTPAGNLATLRAAWSQMLADQSFRDEIKQRKWDFVPTPYSQLEAFYRKVVAEAPADVVKELNEIFP